MSDQLVTGTPEGGIVPGKKCPRCDRAEVAVMVKSPAGDMWEIYRCGWCHYSWFSNEEVNDPKRFNPKFKLTEKDIENMMVLPPLPKPDAE